MATTASRSAFAELSAVVARGPPQSALAAVAASLRATVPAPAAAAAALDAPTRDGAVPFTVKANLAASGLPATAGSRALARYTPGYTAAAVERLLAERGRVVGVTNMDEFGMGSATRTSAHGRALNPWSPALGLAVAARAVAAGRGAGAAGAAARARAGAAVTPAARRARGWLVPGGSSGGAAAAVSLGLGAAALASDTGGSVRLPAALCGAVGLKPSYGALPRHGLIAYAPALDTVGVLARSVWAAAAAYGAAAGADARDATGLPRAHAPWTALQTAAVLGYAPRATGGAAYEPAELCDGAPLKGVVVGVPAGALAAPGGGGADADAGSGSGAAVDAVEAAAAELERAGATVVRVDTPAARLATRAYYVLAPAGAASELARYDGVRFGHRAGASEGVDAGGGGFARLAARTRGEAFGREVRRRVLLGTLVLARGRGGRGDLLDAARAGAAAVRAEFGGLFRPPPLVGAAAGAGAWAGAPRGAAWAPAEALGLAVAGNAAAHPSAGAADGVDVILSAAAPSGAAWSADDADDNDAGDGDDVSAAAAAEGGERAAAAAAAEVAADAMTIPASLAGLPAIALPVGLARAPAAIVDAAAADAAAGAGLRGGAIDAAAVVAAARAAGPAGVALPTAVHLTGRFGDEATLLRVAAVLEARVRFPGLPLAFVEALAAGAAEQGGKSE